MCAAGFSLRQAEIVATAKTKAVIPSAPMEVHSYGNVPNEIIQLKA